MYYMVNSSKGISSIFLAKWIGISQKSAWKMGHAIRQMMAPGDESQPVLNGIVELDEKYFGTNPVMKKASNTSGPRELPYNAFSLQFREMALYEPVRLIAIEFVN